MRKVARLTHLKKLLPGSISIEKESKLDTDLKIYPCRLKKKPSMET